VGLASSWRCRRTRTLIIPETTGNVTALIASEGIPAFCLEEEIKAWGDLLKVPPRLDTDLKRVLLTRPF